MLSYSAIDGLLGMVIIKGYFKTIIVMGLKGFVLILRESLKELLSFFITPIFTCIWLNKYDFHGWIETALKLHQKHTSWVFVMIRKRKSILNFIQPHCQHPFMVNIEGVCRQVKYDDQIKDAAHFIFIPYHQNWVKGGNPHSKLLFLLK